MDRVVRFGVSCEPKLVKQFDDIIKKRGYANRSEAIRDMIRDYTSKEEKNRKNATITIIYDHRVKSYNTLESVEHDFHCLIKSSSRRYLGKHRCVEMMYVEGVEEKISRCIEKLKKVKSVKEIKVEYLENG